VPLFFLELKKKGGGAKGRRADPGDAENRLAKRLFSDFVREISNPGRNNKKNNNQTQYNKYLTYNTCNIYFRCTSTNSKTASSLLGRRGIYAGRDRKSF
jgi:hypothetical protein